MSPTDIFNMHLALGYVAWLLCFATYIWPRLKSMDQVAAQRAIATLHSFRFFGLVFIIPGVVGSGLPPGFADLAAYGDLATGVLAMLALLTVRIRALFWPLVFAFNLVGATDIIVDYYHGILLDLPGLAGQLGATYAIPIIYVPLLMITHLAAFRLSLRPQAKAAESPVAWIDGGTKGSGPSGGPDTGPRTEAPFAIAQTPCSSGAGQPRRLRLRAPHSAGRDSGARDRMVSACLPPLSPTGVQQGMS